MQISNHGRGIHAREVPGIDRLKTLPDDWYAFTNLEMSIGAGQSREIDIVIVSDDRIILADVKDWHGRIVASEGRWFHRGRDMGQSPVSKIRENARKFAEILRAHVKERNSSQSPGSKKLSVPFVQGLVIQTGRGQLNEIAENEKPSAFLIGDFLQFVSDPRARVDTLGVVRVDPANPLTSRDSRWRHILSRFFNASTGNFRPGRMRYGTYKASSDDWTFRHKTGLFAEFDVEDEAAGNASGLLRKWNFAQADTRFQTEEGRFEIAGRERKVISYLNDRSEDAETSILQPRLDDPEKSVGYWEVFDRRRRLKRLSDFIATEVPHLSKSNRIELARQVLHRAALVHSVDAAHLDLGNHSIWLESPTTVRFSHFLAATFPEVQTLGQHRYQFLSSAALPEDLLNVKSAPKSKDCYLLGVAVHGLLFGTNTASDGQPLEWDLRSDPANSFSSLHNWFERALSWDPAHRFATAAEMLVDFNQAVSEQKSGKTVLEGLERFRHWRSQRQLLQDLPSTEDVKVTDEVEIWRSNYNGEDVLVKMWKRASWSDIEAEGSRILEFLERADAMRCSPCRGCAEIRKAAWLLDSIVLVQQWVDAPTLSSIKDNSVGERVTVSELRLLKSLVNQIIQLHDAGTTHGDLKPDNILVIDGDDPEVLLIDMFDFSPHVDGELLSSAYCPSNHSDRFERDRFAVTKIVEEVLSSRTIDQAIADALVTAIFSCRNDAPANGTLLPLLEALETALNPRPAPTQKHIQISIRNAEHGIVLPDEGVYGIRLGMEPNIIFLRGATEEIGVRLSPEGIPLDAWRRQITQRQIQKVLPFEFARLEAQINVLSNSSTELSALAFITSLPGYTLARSTGTTTLPAADPAEEPDFTPEQQHDVLDETIASEPLSDIVVDVPALWKALIKAEDDLTIEGIAVGESSFRRDKRRHIVGFELQNGTFDFARDDRVFVERQNPRGGWRDVGLLDTTLSSPRLLVIDASRNFPDAGNGLIADGTTLRFHSHFEITSRTRRKSAIERLLSGDSVFRPLRHVFTPSANFNATFEGIECTDSDFKKKYSFNDGQAAAFSDILKIRPLGLLQGPPGTGKTRFIGALVHHALSTGLARNVLLASQSHEAVNNAAEAALRLFDAASGPPSLVRVGQEGSVSDRLLPFHAARIEALYKDHFRATALERLKLVAAHLGIPNDISSELSYLELTVRPVAHRLFELSKEGESSNPENRVAALRETLSVMLKNIGATIQPDDHNNAEEFLREAFQHVAEKAKNITPDVVRRFRAIAKLGRDFVGLASSQYRSFETLLAGTRQIVAGTCVGLGRSSLGLTTTPFDLVIVDEAARCTASELAVPLQAGSWIVLVGDHAQLEPSHSPVVVNSVFAETSIPKREIVRSDFERVFSAQYGKAAGRSIYGQYRMLAPIGRIVSSAFYNEKLQHLRTEPEIHAASLPPSLEKPLLWISTDSLHEAGFQRSPPDAGHQLSNPTEADAIICLLKEWQAHDSLSTWIRTQSKHSYCIGIICMYAAQRDLVRKKISLAGFSDAFKASISVGTVDSYQGKENPIVILSLVRNNDQGKPGDDGLPCIRPGFMSRPNRINVAFSRGMDRLIVIGAKGRWHKNSPIARIITAFEKEQKDGEAKVYDISTFLRTSQAQDSVDEKSTRRVRKLVKGSIDD